MLQIGRRILKPDISNKLLILRATLVFSPKLLHTLRIHAPHRCSHSVAGHQNALSAQPLLRERIASHIIALVLCIMAQAHLNPINPRHSDTHNTRVTVPIEILVRTHAHHRTRIRLPQLTNGQHLLNHPMDCRFGIRRHQLTAEKRLRQILQDFRSSVFQIDTGHTRLIGAKHGVCIEAYCPNPL